MAALVREAEFFPNEMIETTDSDSGQTELLETDCIIPGESINTVLIASDSYEDLNYATIDITGANETQRTRQNSHSGNIHTLVKKKAKRTASTSNNKPTDDEDADASTTESNDEAKSNFNENESSEVSAEGSQEDNLESSLGDLSLSLNQNEEESPQTTEAPLPHIPRPSDSEDVNSLEWKQQKKHIFILSESGKPIYSRHGKEDKLVTVMGVMQALVSFVQDSNHDQILSIVAGEHTFVFMNRDHLTFVGVTRGRESMQQMLLQLNYMYNQVISVLTHSTLTKIFKSHRNYDLRRPLSGAEKFFDNLLNLMDVEPGLLLTSVRCLPLDSSVREIISQTIAQHAKVKDLVFAVVIAQNQLVALVRMKIYYLHPMDLHLIINLINASESFKAAESWTPICLPKFDPSGFLQAHVSYLDEECQTCLLLLSVDIEAFYTLSECKAKIKERLVKYNALQAINNSLRKMSYSIHQCGISDLRHFLYKARSTAQYTSPELEAPYNTRYEQDRLFGLYQYLHHRIHTSGRPLKILFHVGDYETLLGWVTQGFELYAVFGPLVTKTQAIHAVNKLLRWIKREENRLFILNSVTF